MRTTVRQLSSHAIDLYSTVLLRDKPELNPFLTLRSVLQRLHSDIAVGFSVQHRSRDQCADFQP